MVASANPSRWPAIEPHQLRGRVANRRHRNVYGAEILTAVSLILGVFVRFGGMLLLLMLSFALHRYGRSLGIDAIIVPRLNLRRTVAGRVLAEAA